MDQEEDVTGAFYPDLLEPEELELIKQTIAEDFERYAIWACLAALGIEDADGNNPLLVRNADGPVAAAPIYRDVAWILLERLTGMARPREEIFAGYWSIAEWIAHKVKEPRDLGMVKVECYRGDVHRGFLIRDFFRVQLNLFEYIARSALVLVYHGVPLYRQNEDGTSLELLPFTDEDYVYLFKKGQYFDRVDVDEFPFWAKAYYFKLEHLQLEPMFFNEESMDLSVEELAKHRELYRKNIGFEGAQGGGPLPRTSQSTLLDLVPKVLERFYGPSHVATDPDTWTKQTVVIEWLTTTFKISDREAGAIDVVTRPDYARRKSR